MSAMSKTRPPVSLASSVSNGRLSDGSSISRLGGSTRNVVVEARMSEPAVAAVVGTILMEYAPAWAAGNSAVNKPGSSADFSNRSGSGGAPAISISATSSVASAIAAGSV